jgi:hypothetical protein
MACVVSHRFLALLFLFQPDVCRAALAAIGRPPAGKRENIPYSREVSPDKDGKIPLDAREFSAFTVIGARRPGMGLLAKRPHQTE